MAKRYWGVWEMPSDVIGQRYRKGNWPIRGDELKKEAGGRHGKLLKKFDKEEDAIAYKNELNARRHCAGQKG